MGQDIPPTQFTSHNVWAVSHDMTFCIWQRTVKQTSQAMKVFEMLSYIRIVYKKLFLVEVTSRYEEPTWALLSKWRNEGGGGGGNSDISPNKSVGPVMCRISHFYKITTVRRT